MDDAQETVKLSVVVPCWNEEAALPLFLPRLIDACWSVTEDYEIILVNDGSTDTTGDMIASCAEKEPHVIGVQLARHYGRQVALTAGLDLCRGERVLTLAADGQEPPELLPDMLRVMESGADVVFGLPSSSPLATEQEREGSLFMFRLRRFFGDVRQPEEVGDFRLINRRVLNALLQMPERQRYLRGMVAWLGLRQMPFAYDRQPRLAGRDASIKHCPLNQAFDLIARFTALPLRLVLRLCLGCAGVAAVAVLGVFVAALLGFVAFGSAVLAVLFLFFMVAQFIGLGLVAEYLGRVYSEAKQRPLYLIDAVIQKTED